MIRELPIRSLASPAASERKTLLAEISYRKPFSCSRKRVAAAGPRRLEISRGRQPRLRPKAGLM